jgi:hypothetical protein
MSDDRIEDTTEEPSWKYPHAFHQNLPPHHLDADGIPLITKLAYKKSRYIIRLVESMHLSEELLANDVDMEREEENRQQIRRNRNPWRLLFNPVIGFSRN